MTPEQITEHLEIWAKTLCSFPSAYPQRYKSNWPEVLQSYHEAYGYNEATTRHVPTPAQIDITSTVEFTWMPLIDESGIYSSPKTLKAIIYMRSLGDSFYTIEGKLRAMKNRPGVNAIGYKSCNRYFQDAVQYLAYKADAENSTSHLSQKCYT